MLTIHQTVSQWSSFMILSLGASAFSSILSTQFAKVTSTNRPTSIPRNSKKRSGFSSNLAPIPYNAFHLSASNFSFHGRIFSENSPSCSSNKNPFFVIRKRSRFCISTCFISYILCSPVCKLLPDRLFYIKQFYINGRSSSKKSKSSSSSSKSGKSKYFSRYSSYF